MEQIESSNSNIKGIILELFKNNKEKRAEAVSNLVLIGKPAVAQLIPLLSDSDWRIRYRTLEALGQIGEVKVLPDIVMLLKDEKDHVRYMAAKSIGLLGVNEVPATLIPLLNDENHYVRQTAENSIKKIKGE